MAFLMLYDLIVVELKMIGKLIDEKGEERAQREKIGVDVCTPFPQGKSGVHQPLMMAQGPASTGGSAHLRPRHHTKCSLWRRGFVRPRRKQLPQCKSDADDFHPSTGRIKDGEYLQC